MTVLRVTEVFHSIQGESTRAGLPCVFVRLTGCPLRCTYCDTAYAFRGGERQAIERILADVLAVPTRLVEITGGEPLAQPAVHELIARLLDADRTVLIETSGAVDISTCDPRAIRILDIKTPGSGEARRNLWSNLDHLRAHDEVKFVITDRSDYEWSREVLRTHRLNERCAAVLFSPVFEQRPDIEIAGCAGLHPAALAAWMIEDDVPARLQLQLHKFLWDPAMRGV